MAIKMFLVIALSYLVVIKINCELYNGNSETFWSENKTCVDLELRQKVKNCECKNTLAIQCVIKNNPQMNETLNALNELGLTSMERLTFVLNISSTPNFPLQKEQKLDLSTLEYFKDLIQLETVATKFQTSIVPIQFTNSTFEGCSKLQELRINAKLQDSKELRWMVKPLTNLTVLDFNLVHGISYPNINAMLHELHPNIEKLHLRRFQTIGQTGYKTSLDIDSFLPGRYENLVQIDLSYNGFSFVSNGWYKVAPNLKFLDMSHNSLICPRNNPFFYEVSMHPTMEILNISHQGFFDPPDETDVYYFNSDTAQLTMRDGINPDESGTIFPKPWLGLLEIVKCLNKVSRGNVSSMLGNDTSMLCAFIHNCAIRNWKTLPCDNLPALGDIIDSDCMWWVKLPIGKNIKELYFSDTILDVTLVDAPGATLCFAENNIRKMDFSNDYTWSYCFNSDNDLLQLTGLDNITEIDLSKNKLTLNWTEAEVHFSKLQKLNISHNYAEIPNELSICSDRNIHELFELDLSYNNLTSGGENLTKRMVENCGKLNALYLGGNNLDSHLLLSLKGSHNLSFIDLSSNQIQTLSSDFQSELETLDNVTIDISNNPLTCACSTSDLHFIKWLQNPSRKTRIVNERNLLCLGQTGTRSLYNINYTKMRNDCLGLVTIITSVSVSVGVIFMTLVIYNVYRTRFRLKYKFFTLQQWFERKFFNRGDTVPQTAYEYDAFVSYSSDDRFWVHDVLMKTLEETYGFKLVIHYRDIPLGVNVQHAIDEKMRKSREYILVISQNFLESDWCQLEMEEAYRESLRRRTHLALIVLGDVPARIDNPTANKLLDENNYLQWKIKSEEKNTEKQDLSSRKLFWAKLVHHLYGGGNSCCCCNVFEPRNLDYRDVQQFTESSVHDSMDNNRDDIEDETSNSLSAGFTV